MQNIIINKQMLVIYDGATFVKSIDQSRILGAKTDNTLEAVTFRIKDEPTPYVVSFSAVKAINEFSYDAGFTSTPSMGALTPQTNLTFSAFVYKLAEELEFYIALDVNTSGVVKLQAAYNADTNVPDLTSGTANDAIKAGMTWKVTVAGTFHGENVHPGDLIIAQADNPPASIAAWSTVQGNLDDDALGGGPLTFKALVSSPLHYTNGDELTIGNTYIVFTIESGDDISNTGYGGEPDPFVCLVEQPTVWGNGTKFYDVTSSQPAVTVIQNDFGAELTWDGFIGQDSNDEIYSSFRVFNTTNDFEVAETFYTAVPITRRFSNADGDEIYAWNNGDELNFSKAGYYQGGQFANSMMVTIERH